ncbi:MAG TPA: FkbM family methyltransferase [Stellaceae bacterium]
MLLRAAQYRAASLLNSFVDADTVSRVAKYMFLAELLRDRKIEVILDVGANVGQFAQAMRHIGYKGLIVSFEPQAEEFAQITKAMAGDGKWTGFNAALGETDETREIYRMESTVFSSFNRPSSDATRQFEAGNRVVEARPVPVRRLDSVLTGLSCTRDLARTFLKSDTQGYELQVFRGLGEMLPSIGAILCEISSVPIYERTPHMSDVLRFLRGQGFLPACFFPVNRLANGGAVEFDCILTNAGAAAP